MCKVLSKSLFAALLVFSLFVSCFFNNSVSMAKKYYSLRNVGIKEYYYTYDTEVVSLKGKTLTYNEIYSTSYFEQKRVKRKAKITNKTKYYVGDSARFVEKNGYANQAKAVKIKWLRKVNKKSFFKTLYEDNYSYAVIHIKNGKVVSIVTNVILAG